MKLFSRLVFFVFVEKHFEKLFVFLFLFFPFLPPFFSLYFHRKKSPLLCLFFVCFLAPVGLVFLFADSKNRLSTTRRKVQNQTSVGPFWGFFRSSAPFFIKCFSKCFSSFVFNVLLTCFSFFSFGHFSKLSFLSIFPFPFFPFCFLPFFLLFFSLVFLVFFTFLLFSSMDVRGCCVGGMVKKMFFDCLRESVVARPKSLLVLYGF